MIAPAPSFSKVSNPPCPACGKNMKSMGKGQGYRCRECGTKAREPVTRSEEREHRPGLVRAAGVRPPAPGQAAEAHGA